MLHFGEFRDDTRDSCTNEKKIWQPSTTTQTTKKVTEVASLEIADRNIFYLITKEKFWQKPTCDDIFQSLQNLEKVCQERKVMRLACPRLAMDRDGIKWEIVRSMLYYTFRNSEIEIQIVTQEQLSKENQLRIIREFHETPLGGHQGINRT